jgi:hypothetical protein
MYRFAVNAATVVNHGQSQSDCDQQSEAMTLPAALGANLWILAVALPLALGRTWGLDARAGLMLVLLATLPLTLLAWGVRRRSTAALLVAFPAACALPEVIGGDARLLVPAPFLLVAGTLIAYLFAVAWALARVETAGEPAPLASALPSASVPARWRRRLRVYRGLVVTAALVPLVLIAWTDLLPSTRTAFAESFGPRAAWAQTAATCAVALVCVGLYRGYFIGPLDDHLHHDREVRTALEIAKRQGRRGRPRPGFYVAVLAALTAMTALLLQRAQ